MNSELKNRLKKHFSQLNPEQVADRVLATDRTEISELFKHSTLSCIMLTYSEWVNAGQKEITVIKKQEPANNPSFYREENIFSLTGFDEFVTAV